MVFLMAESPNEFLNEKSDLNYITFYCLFQFLISNKGEHLSGQPPPVRFAFLSLIAYNTEKE